MKHTMALQKVTVHCDREMLKMVDFILASSLNLHSLIANNETNNTRV
jgi:hypothetical protein